MHAYAYHQPTGRWRLVLPSGRYGPMVSAHTALAAFIAAALAPPRRPEIPKTIGERRRERTIAAWNEPLPGPRPHKESQ